MEIIKEINKDDLININDVKTLHSIGCLGPNGNINPNKQTHITSFNIPTHITKLNNNCFVSCSNLSSITIPDSVECIGACCFGSCYNLSSIKIPDSVKYIGSNCFASCSNLSSITIPDSVKYIGSNCFSCCYNLSSITIPDSIEYIGYSCFYICSNLSSIKIPDSVKCLGDNCFSGCSNLSSITIPDSVEYIGYNCFTNCSKLSSITIPDSIKYIGGGCFYNCTKLRSIYIPEDKINLIVVQLNYLNSDCKIITYKPKLSENKQTVIEEPKIIIPEITEEYQPDLINFNEYIEERTEILENRRCTNSIMKYHETIIDIADEIYRQTKLKSEELKKYIELVQNYNTNLIKISSDISKKIKFHESKIKELEENNYKVPELNLIKDKLNKIILFEEDDDFNTVVKLNDNYYLVNNDLIIPKTDNPYTEIYKLPCDFNKINPENKKILTKSEKKIALLSIDYQHEYIDLSNTDIQYFVNTFKKCENLKEIVYPESKEIII